MNLNNTDSNKNKNQEIEQFYRYYLVFMVSQFISIFGSNIVSFVIIWWITVETQSALYLAASSFIIFGVRIILSPIAGVYVDRWNRKWVIGIADFGQAIVILYIIYRFSNNSAGVYDILLMVFLASIFASFHGPAVNSIVPLMVPPEKISRINSMNYFANVVTNVIGAPIGALLLSFWTISELLWIDVITFAFTVIPLAFITIPSVVKENILPGSKTNNSFVHDFKEGLSIIKHKGMIGFFFVFPITNFFEVPKNILFPLLISETYLGDAVLFALLISSTQLTTSLTALLMSWKNFTEKMDPAKVVLFGLIGIFVGGFMVAIPPPGILGYLIIIPILGVILSGFCSPFINITMQNIQHKVIPADKLGRVSATSTSASLSMIPPATILTGVITDFLGNGALRFMFFSSCIMGIIAIITIWFLTDLSNIKYQLNKNLENNFDKQHEIKSKQTTQPASD